MTKILNPIFICIAFCFVMGGHATAQLAGVSVDKIDDGSVYQKLGLKTGDVIKSINNTPVSTRKDIDDAFSKIASGGKVRLEVLRAGQVQIFHIRTGMKAK